MTSSARAEYKFLAEVDDELKCQICLGVARDPLQHEECGKLFCDDCLEKYGKKKPCPNCRQQNSQYYVDKRGIGKRTIQALGVKCHNADRQCPWEGTVGTVEAHVATCEFTLLLCPNKCLNEKLKVNQYMKKELDQHLEFHCVERLYKCQYCGEEGTYAAITITHDKTCRKKPIPCPNEECKVTIERGLVGDHVERECAYAVLPCKYRGFGCNAEKSRQDMVLHERDDKQLHLDMAMNATLEIMKDNMKLKSDNEKLRKKLTKLSSAVNVLQFAIYPQLFTLRDYEKVKKNENFFKFPPFYVEHKSYHLSLWVRASGEGAGQGTHVSVFMAIEEGDYDADLKWPLLGQVTFTLLNQLEDRNHHTESLILTAKQNALAISESGKVWGVHKFIPHAELGFDPVHNTQYLKDDTLYFKMNVELDK